MSVPSQAPDGSTGEMTALFEAKVRAELAAADRLAPGADRVPGSGTPFAEVMLVKGDPGPAEDAGGAALSGPDGDAAHKALAALGFPQDSLFATVARPESGIDPELLRERLRLQIEAVDPYAIVALDDVASRIVAAALDIKRPAFGRPVMVRARVVLAVDGLERSLADESAKRRVWKQLRTLEPQAPSL